MIPTPPWQPRRPIRGSTLACLPIAFFLRGELDPRGGVVAGLLEGAHVPVHAGGDEVRSKVGAQEQVIDADARVADEGAPEIIPESVDIFVRVEGAQCIRPSL